MTPFTVLYYPSWNPPVRWLRSMLLFMDRVEVIRPRDVDAEYHVANASVFELAPHVFGEIQEYESNLDLDESEKALLGRGFSAIAKKAATRDPKVTIEFDQDGRWSFNGYSFLHRSKTNQYIRTQLRRYKLVDKTRAKFANGLHSHEGFFVVNADASCLILSMLANRVAQSRRLRTLTDRPLDYIINALGRRPSVSSDTTAMALASSVITAQIPRGLENLTAKQFVSIRNRYEDLRRPFHAAIRSLCDDYRLAELATKEDFEEAVREATREFSMETDELRKTAWARGVKTWGTIGLGILSGACALSSGAIAVAGVGISVALHVYQSLQASPYTTDRGRAQQLLGQLRGEVMNPVLLRKIALP